MKSLFVSLTVAALCAAETFAAPMGTAFTYQGRLNDGGTPANNVCDFTFSLHDDPVNLASIGTYIILSAVPVTNGLFTVQLNADGEFGTNAFNGQARWLQIGVRTNSANMFINFTFLSPRQQLDATPQAMFALNASNAVNASFATNVADGAITSSKLADGSVGAQQLAPGALSWSSLAGIPAGFADGMDNDTTYTPGAGLSLSGANQFSVNFGGAGSANTAARSDHNHFGANWAGTSSGLGLIVVNSSTTGSGLYSQQGTGSGKAAPIGYKAAVWGESSQGDAVYGASGSAFGAGVYGYATAASGANYGVYGQSDSTNGVGVLARGSGTSGTALRVSNGAIRVSGAGANSHTPAFVHVVTAGNYKTNIFLGATVIDNAYCNNDPNAMLIVTPNWGGGGANLTFSQPVSVCYDDGFWGFATNRWVLMRSDVIGGSLDVGYRYNVLVIKP